MKSEEDEEEERSRVLTSLFIRIYQRVKSRKRERERGEQRTEDELIKSRKPCGESELQRYVSVARRSGGAGPRRGSPPRTRAKKINMAAKRRTGSREANDQSAAAIYQIITPSG